MSIEQAIFELAAAVRYLADSNRRDLTASATLIAKSERTPLPEIDTEVKGADRDEVAEEREIEQAVQKVEQAAADKKLDAQPEDGTESLDAPMLDYKMDVCPALMSVAQKSRDQLVALLAKYGAKNGPGLKPEHYKDILADANQFLGG